MINVLMNFRKKKINTSQMHERLYIFLLADKKYRKVIAYYHSKY